MIKVIIVTYPRVSLEMAKMYRRHHRRQLQMAYHASAMKVDRNPPMSLPRLPGKYLVRMRRTHQNLRTGVPLSPRGAYLLPARKSGSVLELRRSSLSSSNGFLLPIEVPPLPVARRSVICSACKSVRHKYGFRTGNASCQGVEIVSKELTIALLSDAPKLSSMRKR